MLTKYFILTIAHDVLDKSAVFELYTYFTVDNWGGARLLCNFCTWVSAIKW